MRWRWLVCISRDLTLKPFPPILNLLFYIAISIQFCHSVVSDSLRPHGLQHAKLPCPSPTPRACSNSCPSSWWCHPTISSTVVPIPSCLQSFPASGSFPMGQFFASLIVNSRSTGLPWWLSGEEITCQCRRCSFHPWVGKIPWRKKWQPILGFLPGKSHRQRSPAGYSPWGGKRVRHDLETKQ